MGQLSLFRFIPNHLSSFRIQKYKTFHAQLSGATSTFGFRFPMMMGGSFGPAQLLLAHWHSQNQATLFRFIPNHLSSFRIQKYKTFHAQLSGATSTFGFRSPMMMGSFSSLALAQARPAQPFQIHSKSFELIQNSEVQNIPCTAFRGHFNFRLQVSNNDGRLVWASSASLGALAQSEPGHPFQIDSKSLEFIQNSEVQNVPFCDSFQGPLQLQPSPLPFAGFRELPSTVGHTAKLGWTHQLVTSCHRVCG